MYKKERILVKKRFINYDKIDDIIYKIKSDFSHLFGKIRYEVRDHVLIATLVNWTVADSEHVPESIGVKILQVDRYISTAIMQKDNPIKVVTDFNSGWKYFLYTSIDDNLYGVIETNKNRNELIDMSTGKQIAGQHFDKPYDAIEWLLH